MSPPGKRKPARPPGPPVRSGTRLGVLVGGTRYGLPGSQEPKHCLDLLDLDRAPPESEPARIPLGFLAHGFAPHPRKRHQAALLEKQGPGGALVDLVEQRVLAPIHPLAGHAFYGHGAYSREGDVLFAIESELASGDGVISIRDPATFAPLGTFPTYGKAPHDCQLIEEGKTLAITNGGGRVDTQDLASVTFVDVATRKLVDRHEIANPEINAGHIALTRRFRELAVVSAPRAGLPADVSLGGLSLRPRGKPLVLVTEPRRITGRFVGESLSVCIHEPTRLVAATHPFGHLVTFWHLDSSQLVAAMDVPNPRGVTLTLDGSRFAIACGEVPSILLVEVPSLVPVMERAPGLRCFGGSHVYAWAQPA